MDKLKNYVIILASGLGNRYGRNVPKQFLKIGEKTILEYTVEVFEESQFIDNIIVVITPEYKDIAENILKQNNYKKIINLLEGGATRKESSCIGINAIKEDEANVLIHDCARPFVTQTIIEDCVNLLEKYNAINVAIPVTDTIIEVDNGAISNMLCRSKLMQVQTPQCFKLSLIKKAHEMAKDDSSFTDDCGMVIKYNLADVFIANGSQENIKITYPSDLLLANEILRQRNKSF